MRKFYFILSFLLLFVLVGCSKDITLSFETNGAGNVESFVLVKNEVLELPTVSKTGFTFKGWYLDAEFVEQFAKQEIKADTKFYAKWEVIKFTVTFKSGDEVLKSDSVEYGKSATAPAAPTKVGFDFSGWDKAFANVTSDLTVNATFGVISYTVKFFDHDATQIGDDIVVNHGDTVTAPANPIREGYKFDGWDKELTNVTANTSINATYEKEIYTVTFVDHNNTVLKVLTNVEYKAGVVAPSNPTRVGYEFNGWDKEFAEIVENTTIRATYTLINYAINYFDGSTALTHIPGNFTIEQAINLTTYDKTGFLFVGWFSDPALTVAVSTIAKGTTSAVTVYGKWLDESVKNTVSYELNGGVWTWTQAAVTVPNDGIDANTNLPELFMADFFMYLKDNNLLSSPTVHETLRKTTWATFKADYDDPVAIYNHTSTISSRTPDGYSQYFYTTATGNATTKKITSIEGGFFGTEPYKTKYANLAQLLAYFLPLKYAGNEFWGGEGAKALAGFVLDGYFYGTQGAGSGAVLSLRSVLPNTNKVVNFANDVASIADGTYQVLEYVNGTVAKLVAPSKDNYVFRGWYDNVGLTGDAISSIAAGVTPAAKYYAKWELVE